MTVVSSITTSTGTTEVSNGEIGLLSNSSVHFTNAKIQYHALFIKSENGYEYVSELTDKVNEQYYYARFNKGSSTDLSI
jgi:hypothetical protein